MQQLLYCCIVSVCENAPEQSCAVLEEEEEKEEGEEEEEEEEEFLLWCHNNDPITISIICFRKNVTCDVIFVTVHVQGHTD